MGAEFWQSVYSDTRRFWTLWKLPLEDVYKDHYRPETKKGDGTSKSFKSERTVLISPTKLLSHSFILPWKDFISDLSVSNSDFVTVLDLSVSNSDLLQSATLAPRIRILLRYRN